MSEFEKLLTSYQNRINSKLESLLPSDDSILTEAIRYSVLDGGKRLRPILVYLIGELGNAKNESQDILSGSVEIQFKGSSTDTNAIRLAGTGKYDGPAISNNATNAGATSGDLEAIGASATGFVILELKKDATFTA